MNPDERRLYATIPWALVGLYAALLALASLLPSGGGGSAAGGWDSGISPTLQNTLHIPAYAILTVLLLVAATQSWQLRSAGTLALAAACIVYGAAIEWLQAVAIPGRVGSFSDAFLNALGGAGGWFAWVIFRGFGEPHRPAATRIASEVPPQTGVISATSSAYKESPIERND